MMRRQREVSKKAIGLHVDWRTTTLHVHHAFLYIFLLSQYNYHVTLPNFMFWGGRGHETTTYPFLLQNFDTVP